MTIEPDTKDWTWVLQRPCPECGFDAGAVDRDRLGDEFRANAARWAPVLLRADAAIRPSPATWSPTEYACHVRDVHTTFGERLRLMLTEDDPLFTNWNQDDTALADRYDQQRPDTVSDQLVAAAHAVAARYDTVRGDAWQRPGRRDNGSVFTVDTLGRYHLHDVVHHLHDVRG